MAAPKSTPKDAQVMEAVLKDMGVVEFEPRIINQMLEFCYRYVTDILDDAKVYSSHANKKTLDADDIKLAIQCRLDHSFTTPPPRDLLMDVARHKNKTPLPIIKPYTGPKLPPDRFCVASANYRLKSLKKLPVNFATRAVPKPRVQISSGGIGTSIVTPRVNIQQSTGRSGLTIVSRGVSQPSVTMRTAAPKMPIIRVTPGLSAAPGSGQTLSTSGPSSLLTTLSAPLGGGGMKRKHEDDDYDNP